MKTNHNTQYLILTTWCLFFVFNFSFFTLSAQTYILTTIAGLRTVGYSGDGGLATNANLFNPTGIFVDNTGKVFICDWANSRLRMVNNIGIITTIAGNGKFGFSGDGGPATSAEISGPMGVFTDAAGNIFVADIGNSRIRKINTNGIISTIAGNGFYGFSGDGGNAVNAEIGDPVDICSDNSGDIYIADVFNYRIRKISNAGVISTVAGCGTRGYSGDGGPAINAEFYYPTGVAVDNSGNIFIADQDNFCIRKVNAGGIISTIAGNGISGFSGDGGNADMAELSYAPGVAVDKEENVYIADGFNNRIRLVNTNGIISTIAGNGMQGDSGVGGVATLASLYNPVSIVCDTSDNLYFANQYNNHIQKLTKVSAENPPHPSFTVFPNPNNGVFNVNVEDFTSTLKFEIYNVLGQLISVYNLNSGTTEINIVGKSKGIYLYRVIAPQPPNVLGMGKLIVL